MVGVTIDGRDAVVSKGSTIIQACESAGVEIPRFCYHERLSIAGNCRRSLPSASVPLIVTPAASMLML